MKRTLLLVGTLAGLATAALYHHYSQASLAAGPAAMHHAAMHHAALGPAPTLRLAANRPAPAEQPVTDAEALRITRRLYAYQADLIAAEMEGDANRARHVLDEAFAALHDLMERPGLAERPRFRAAYRALTSEYEERYGAPDTLDLPTGEIFAVRQGLFGALNAEDGASHADDAPHVGDVIPKDLRLAHTDVPMTLNWHVRQSIAFLVRRPKYNVYPWMERGATYFPMIEHVLAEENVPDELKYLPLIESGLNPYAVSRAQAVGMWQFVAPTARAYGLTIDPWVDERRDPEKATRAAAHLLRDLHDMFGDWHLALAGYNCSPAVVMRAVRKAEARLGRKATFWDIYPDLPDETRGYVPMFIATALVASNPTAFGLQPPPSGPRYAFDHVPLEGVHTLREVAEMADVRLDRLRALNPELRSGRLPHSKDPYLVRLPYGSYDAFAEAYARLDAADRVRAVEHTVRPGETVGQIARRYQVTRPALLRVNPRRSAPIASDIATREERAPVRLRVPARRYRGNAALLEAAGGARPLRVQYGTRATRPLSSLPSSRQARMPATLTELAASFPTPEELAAAREATAPSSSAASKKGGTHP